MRISGLGDTCQASDAIISTDASGNTSVTWPSTCTPPGSTTATVTGTSTGQTTTYSTTVPGVFCYGPNNTQCYDSQGNPVSGTVTSTSNQLISGVSNTALLAALAGTFVLLFLIDKAS